MFVAWHLYAPCIYIEIYICTAYTIYILNKIEFNIVQYAITTMMFRPNPHYWTNSYLYSCKICLPVCALFAVNEGVRRYGTKCNSTNFRICTRPSQRQREWVNTLWGFNNVAKYLVRRILTM